MLGSQELRSLLMPPLPLLTLLLLMPRLLLLLMLHPLLLPLLPLLLEKRSRRRDGLGDRTASPRLPKQSLLRRQVLLLSRPLRSRLLRRSN